MPEVRLLLLTLEEAAERCPFRLAWSAFRRHHQAVAQHCHTARRARRQHDSPGTPAIQVLPALHVALSEELWQQIVPFLPPQKPRTGRPNHDHRTMLAGMLWIVYTGASWRELPERFGPWQTVYGRYQRWRHAGIWQQVLDTLRLGNASAPA